MVNDYSNNELFHTGQLKFSCCIAFRPGGRKNTLSRASLLLNDAGKIAAFFPTFNF